MVILFVLHQDFWLWDDQGLVFGFLPVGLGYHMIYSLAVAGIWALAVRYAWPHHIEEWASEGEQTTDSKPEGGAR